MPLESGAGDGIYSGAINLDDLLRIEITRTGEASTLGKVIGLMQQAERAKPPITRLLERYAGRYILLVLLIAAVTWFRHTNDAQAMLAVRAGRRLSLRPGCCPPRPRLSPGSPWPPVTGI